MNDLRLRAAYGRSVDRKDSDMAVSALPRDPSPNPPKHAPIALVDRRQTYVQCTAEVAECTCPDFCERDHGNE